MGVALYLSYCDYVCIEQLHEKNASSEMTPRIRKLTLVNDFFCLLRLSAPSDRAVHDLRFCPVRFMLPTSLAMLALVEH